MYKLFHINKSVKLLLVAALALTLLLSIGGKSSANHKYSELYEIEVGGVFQGHFGQPTGSVVSGSYTFIASVTNNTDRVYFSVTSPDFSETSLSQESATSVLNGDGEDYYRYSLDTTLLPNGDYLLQAAMECDDCTPNGITDQVYHYVGTNYIKFTVDNPDITNEISPNEDPSENSCTDKLDAASLLASSIILKHKNNLDYIDNFYQQAANFYETQNIENTDLDNQIQNIPNVRKDASDNILVLESAASFDCESSLKNQVLYFVETSEETRNSLDSYKNSVIDLIVILLGVL